MITACCVVCDSIRIVGPFEQITDTCSDECGEEFEHLVQLLLGGGNCVAMGIDPESRLGLAAIAEARRVKFRWARESYEAKAEAYARSLPEPGSRSAVWRRYFT